MSELMTLAQAIEQRVLRAIDYQFARFVAESVGLDSSHPVFWVALLLSRAHGDGHTCLWLEELAEQSVPRVAERDGLSQLPAASALEDLLISSGAAVSANSSSAAPMIIEQGRVYIARYWFYEQQVANALREKAQQQLPVDASRAAQALAQLGGATPAAGDIDWQQIACALALIKPLTVITGGPGTGKTTTVLRLLALVLAQAPDPERLIIRMAAPTGKAAVRMTESIRNAKAGLAAPDAIKALIPEHASTLHRLLGAVPQSVMFRHHKHNPLAVDLLVLDEASMVDLPMMAKLLDALPAQCRLIVLGDKDQLSSVEAGSVMGDLCASIGQGDNRLRQPGSIRMHYQASTAAVLEQITGYDLAQHSAAQASLISDCLCMLQKSWRFGGAIGELASAVNRCDHAQVQAILAAANPAELSWQEIKAATPVLNQAVAHYQQFVEQALAQGMAGASVLLPQFDQYRVLCAVRSGEVGTDAINSQIEQRLRSAGLLQEEGRFYPGKPVMITRNDYHLNLFNGDIGITLRDDDGLLRVCFLQPDGTVRSLLPSRLGEHTTAYAMTIHKSQGSEFAHVAIALPLLEAQCRGLSKELLYTGITRAKQQVSLFASAVALKRAVTTPTQRYSGLAEKLTTP